MADQYGVMPEDYVYDLEILSNARYGQGMLDHSLEVTAEAFPSHYYYFDAI